MSTEEKAFYERIAGELSSCRDPGGGRILAYAEVEEGVSSVSVFFEKADGKGIKYLDSPRPLRNAIIDFWNAWRKTPGNQEWRAMTFSLEGRKFKVDLVYPEDVRDEENRIDRRDKVLARYFGDQQVDYSASKL